ncbi:cutinase-domain-containing protein [Macrophomina phaseolina]|uniref:Cutinase n=1 Tax=Macrophomina phaseolina TaxID=35725 RepID=A0ABQ8GL04_9PEZI|nr:cutinase-domain-containing protein [Macrophomina phaseolina]
MKTTTIVSLFFVGLSLGSPINFEAREPEAVAELEARQFTGTGVTANELKNGPCKPVTYIFARGSTELGNLGQTVGPALANQLKSQFDVAVQGVDYPASLTTNFFGGSLVGISEMRDMFNLAASKCPDTIIVGGGYSQGAALTHRSVEDLSSSVRNRIAGIVTFGDTYNLQSGGRIPGLPQEKLRIICNTGDLVCAGTLIIALPHLDYVRRVPEAVSFLAGRIRAT